MVDAIQTIVTCPTCQQPITADQAMVTCPVCDKAYHRECRWQEGTCLCGHKELTVTPLISREPTLPAKPATDHQALWGWISAVVALLVIAAAVILALAFQVKLQIILIISVVAAALIFDYVNGMHDSGNAIATVISTRALTPFWALLMAAACNLLGALVHGGLAASIATKFADMKVVEQHHLQISLMMILCGLVGASAWSFLTARWGLPVSTSHSLFGGLIGVFLLGGIPLNLEYMAKIGIFMVLAPLMAFSVGWLLMIIFMWCFRKFAPYAINRVFRWLQIGSAASMAFAHGSNDAQKAMGIITLALFAGGFLGGDSSNLHVPTWVKLACALVIALGTAFGGMRVIKTLGHKIIKLDPVHGFAAETVAAITIQLVTFFKVPISTTHVISSSILGIGASKRLSAVRWGVAKNIVIAWVFTIPTCAMAGALLYGVVRLVTGIR